MLVIPAGADVQAVTAMAEAFYWARDLINTPAEDCGPQHMKAEAQALADAHPGARLTVEEGDQLVAANWPAVHTVGRAAARPPVVLDLTWQPSSSSSSGQDLPLVALVGKGVCFDSGGARAREAGDGDGESIIQNSPCSDCDAAGVVKMLNLVYVVCAGLLVLLWRHTEAVSLGPQQAV